MKRLIATEHITSIQGRGVVVTGRAGMGLVGLTEDEVRERWPEVQGVERFAGYIGTPIRMEESIGLLLKYVDRRPRPEL